MDLVSIRNNKNLEHAQSYYHLDDVDVKECGSGAYEVTRVRMYIHT